MLVVVVACSGRKVTWLLVLLALLLLHKVAVAAELDEDMLKLSLVLWKATVQRAKTVPHITVGHAHTVHESKALLAGRQCDTIDGCGTMVNYLEPCQVSVHSFTMSSSKRPEL